MTISKMNLTVDSTMNKVSKNKWRSDKIRTWIKKAGIGAFLFFLIKGLIWIAVFYGLGKYFID